MELNSCAERHGKKPHRLQKSNSAVILEASFAYACFINALLVILGSCGKIFLSKAWLDTPAGMLAVTRHIELIYQFSLSTAPLFS